MDREVDILFFITPRFLSHNRDNTWLLLPTILLCADSWRDRTDSLFSANKYTSNI